MNMESMNKELETLLNSIHNVPNHWHQDNSKEVIIYGAGNMGNLASILLNKVGVNVICFVDKNINLRGELINNIPVIMPKDLTEYHKSECLFAIGVIKVSYNLIVEFLKELGCKKICYLGHLVENTYGSNAGLNAWYFNSCNNKEKEQIKLTFMKLSDEESRLSLLQLLNWYVLGKEYLLQKHITFDDKYFIPEVKTMLTYNEVFVNYGSWDDMSIEKIIDVSNGKFEKMYVFEPKTSKYQYSIEKMQTYVQKNKIIIYPYGLGNNKELCNYTEEVGSSNAYSNNNRGINTQVETIDSLMIDNPYSFLKIYGFGTGWKTVEGAMSTLIKYRPIIAINIHHTEQDFIKIPNLLINNLENYVFLLRLHGYCGAEAVFYALPKERIN